MGIRKHANNVSTTLGTTITNSSTTVIVASADGFPSISAGQTFNITFDSFVGNIEIMIVTAVSGTTFTVTRGAEGTNAVAWNSGSIIQLRPTADSVDRKADLASPALTGTPTVNGLPIAASVDTVAFTYFGGL